MKRHHVSSCHYTMAAKEAMGLSSEQGSRFPKTLSKTGVDKYGRKVRLLPSLVPIGRRTGQNRIHTFCRECDRWVPSGRLGQHLAGKQHRDNAQNYLISEYDRKMKLTHAWIGGSDLKNLPEIEVITEEEFEAKLLNDRNQSNNHPSR